MLPILRRFFLYGSQRTLAPQPTQLEGRSGIIPDQEAQKPERLSPEVREGLLDHAYDQYLAGEITSDQLREAREEYGPDYVAAARVLAERRLAKQGNADGQVIDKICGQTD
jgi:hypothetical protein